MKQTQIARTWAALMLACLSLGGGSAVLAAPKGPPLLPHETQTDNWPLPDYFAEALRQTDFKVSDAARKLTLQGTTEPRLIVLPVQTQAFGMSPWLRALIGAHLDQQLEGIEGGANRQTDVNSVDGPTVRRLDDETVESFVRRYPQSRLLGLYVGHDGAGKAFITLVLRDGRRVTRAHRTVPLPADMTGRLAAITAPLPALLSELGLAPRLTAAPASAACTPERWSLADPAPNASPAARACHAIIVGTLLPEFERATEYSTALDSPAKLAWLATAYVEAGRVPGGPDSFKAIREIAWSQLGRSDAGATAKRFTDSPDPVVKPLSRLLWAWPRARSIPTSSSRGAALDYVEQATTALPPFARAVMREGAGLPEPFRAVDLCSIERLYPSLKLPEACAHGEARRLTGTATTAMTTVVQEWRLASHFKEMLQEGVTLGRADRLKQLMASLPAATAANPFIRRLAASLARSDADGASFETWLQRVQANVRASVQATVDLQRELTDWADEKPPTWWNNSNIKADMTVRLAGDANDRLSTVLMLDMGEMPTDALRWEPGTRATFLQAEPFRSTPYGMLTRVEQPRQQPEALASASNTVAVRPQESAAAPQGLFSPTLLPGGTGMGVDDMKKILETDPRNMEVRVDLALLRLKQGASLAEAKTLIDAHPAESRHDRQVSASHLMALPAHGMFFAAEMDLAKHYYEQVRQIGTGSGSDMHAVARLRQIELDIVGALKVSEARAARYPSDFVRREVAGYLFMTGQPERAWNTIVPYMAMSGQIALWEAAMTGHRMADYRLGQVQDWIAKTGLSRAQIRSRSSEQIYLHRYATIDRVPSDDDIALLGQLGPQQRHLSASLAVSARMTQMALENRIDREGLARLRSDMQATSMRTELKSLYAWIAWNATQGADPELVPMRLAEPHHRVDDVLAKAMILGLEGKTSEALVYLRAARYELSGLALSRLSDDVRSTPYQVALADYLLFRKTGEKAYRDEALKMARGYAVVFPFMAWPYGLQALMEADPAARMTAACRARQLDPGSAFLGLSGMRPDLASAACKKALW